VVTIGAGMQVGLAAVGVGVCAGRDVRGEAGSLAGLLADVSVATQPLLLVWITELAVGRPWWSVEVIATGGVPTMMQSDVP
jgi:hypothetical protein